MMSLQRASGHTRSLQTVALNECTDEKLTANTTHALMCSHTIASRVPAQHLCCRQEILNHPGILDKLLAKGVHANSKLLESNLLPMNWILDYSLTQKTASPANCVACVYWFI